MTTEPVPLERDEPGKTSSAGSPTDSPRSIDGPGAQAGRPRSARRWIYPLLAIAAGVLIYSVLVATREKPRTAEFVPPSPLVRVQEVELRSLRLSVSTRGTVKPRTESDLVAEVSGRILVVSPKLVVGGFFEAGDELLRLDDREHRISRDRARANVALRESEATLAEAEAGRRRQLRERGAASAADLEQFESRKLVASASLDEARAALAQANLDLERTTVRAPFDGRVRDREVDVGQFVSPGTKLGRIFAVDYAEVRLPIQTDDLAFLEGALGRTPPAASGADGPVGLKGTRVQLTGRLGGRDYHWPARLERAEAAIDEQTRMLHVVARVDDPYGRVTEPPVDKPNGHGPTGGAAASMGSVSGGSERAESAGLISDSIPLPSGLFVNAEIEGRLVSDVAVLPLMALRDGDRVFIFEPDSSDTPGSADTELPASAELMTREGRLRVRPVSVLRRDRDRVVINGGLEPEDRIVVSPLRIYSDGMRLRIVEARGS